MTESYDHENWWHATVNLLGAFNCRDCDAMRHWGPEMADCPEHNDEEFLRRCVAVAEHARAEGWTMVENSNFLCPRCSAQAAANRSRKI